MRRLVTALCFQTKRRFLFFLWGVFVFRKQVGETPTLVQPRRLYTQAFRTRSFSTSARCSGLLCNCPPIEFPFHFCFQSATRFLFKWPHFLLAFYQSNYGPKNPPLHNETKRQWISLIVQIHIEKERELDRSSLGTRKNGNTFFSLELVTRLLLFPLICRPRIGETDIVVTRLREISPPPLKNKKARFEIVWSAELTPCVL